MKRPMLAAGAAAVAVSALMLQFGRTAGFALMCIAVVLAVSALFLRRLRFSVLFISVVLLAVSARGTFLLDRAAKINSTSNPVTLNGTVTDCDCGDDYAVYTIKLNSIDGHNMSGKLRLYSSYGINAREGDTITASAVVSAGKSMVNKTYNYSAGVYATARLENVVSLQSEDNIYSRLSSIREHMTDTYFSYLGYDEAAVLTAISSGEKLYLSNTVEEYSRAAGVSHIMVVSGMHLAIITGAFLGLMKCLRLNRRVAGIAGIVVVALIAGVSGFAPSAMRAGLTYLIIFLGMIFCRRPDALNSLFAAVSVIILINPFSVGNISFQLSASATFGILVAAPELVRKLSKYCGYGISGRLMNAVVSAVIYSVSASLFSLPFAIWHFGCFSTVFIVTNLLLTYPVSLSLITAVCGAFLSGVPFLCAPFMFLSGLLSKYMLRIINSLGSMPFSYITFRYPKIAAVTVSIIAVALHISLVLAKRKCTVGPVKKSEFII